VRVARCASVRGQPAGLWVTLTAIFSLAGYAGYRIYDDCESREMNLFVSPAIAVALFSWLIIVPVVLVLVFGGGTVVTWMPIYKMSLTETPAILPAGTTNPALAPRESWWPWYLMLFVPIVVYTGPYLVFAAFYAGLRPRLTLEKIRRRLERKGQLVAMQGALLRVEDITKHFPVRKGVFGRIRGHVKAVDGISFNLEPGRTLGLVGESGCGKTTAGRLILKLMPPTGGRVVFDGVDLSLLSPGEMRAMRRQMQLIFQDPFGSLNPRMTVLGIVGEPMAIHGEAKGRELLRRVEELLAKVGLTRAHVRRYPHEFSGGQRQRIGIARALALNPKFIVCDEPVSALDVSIQAQIINLLRDLQGELGLTYLFIAHDLSVVEHISDDVAVMYLGKIMEKAPSVDLYRKPLHPYTMALLSAIPVPDPSQKKQEIILEGDVPSPLNPPAGCRFHTRCRYMTEKCKEKVPDLREIEPGHFAACIRVEEIQAGAPPTKGAGLSSPLPL
jgi:oligopeptide/dipeptide ABC transporter ATP-binding protein